MGYWLDLCGEAFTVGFAVFDIVMDMWIAYGFYADNRMTLFYTSLLFLAIAQLCYTTLFVCTYGNRWNFVKSSVVFAVVLPFGQMVPLLIYADNVGFEPIVKMRKALGLSGEKHPTIRDGEDLMLYHIRCKLHSHIGFLLEACVEAVPQSILQLIAMQQTGQPELLSVLSIILSISCLASKGYVAAFSVNFRTFVFNGICIAADTLGIFATVSWLSGGSSSSIVAAACGWWYWLAGWAIVPGVLAAGSIFMCEEVCDQWNHWVDIWNDGITTERSRDKLFDIGVGGCICVMGFLPFLVVVLSTKLAMLPLCALGSMDHHGQSTNRGLFD